MSYDGYDGYDGYGDYDYDDYDNFTAVKRASYEHYYEQARRSRTNSSHYTPQGAHGEPTHSEGESDVEPMHALTDHYMFQSSFRGARGRGRAPLEPRLLDMNRMQALEAEDIGDSSYDNEVARQRVEGALQELAIIDDLLSLMMRTSGRYMKFRHAPDSDVWREQVDVHEAVEVPQWMNVVLSEMARKIVPVAVLHMRIDRFVRVYARASAGVVNQALAAAIRALLKDYYVLVAQLEHRLRTATRTKPFTLQQVWFHVVPTLQVFERLAMLIDRVQAQAQPSPQPADVPQEDDGFTTLADKRSNVPDDYESDDEEEDSQEEAYSVRGGTTLNVISNLINHRGGDASARHLYEFLLARATVPFLKMLRRWLHDGVLEKGQRGEFMVTTEALAAEVFLESDASARKVPNFVSVQALTPIFLQPFGNKIVRTGMYLNIVRDCGVDLRKLDRADTDGTVDADQALNGLLNQQRLVEEIEAAYLRANQALMDILLKEGLLFSYFGAVKHYLLFDKADYLGYFLDLAKDELQKNVHMVSLNKLQSALELALLNPASVSHDDPLRDHLRVLVESAPLTDLTKSADKSGVSFMGANAAAEHGLIGAEVLALTLRVPFPYSIVLDAVSMRKYKELGRLLLAMRLTEQNLLNMWAMNRRYATPQATDSAGKLRKFAFHRIYTVRHQMLVCVQQLLYYCCWDVIEPQWAAMMAKMKQVKTVDEMRQVHDDALGTIFRQCGCEKKLPKMIVELLVRCNRFVSSLDSRMKYRTSVLVEATPRKRDNVSARIYDRTVDRGKPVDPSWELKSIIAGIDEREGEYVRQLKHLLGALNHYSRTVDPSFISLAVRLDGNGGRVTHNKEI